MNTRVMLPDPAPRARRTPISRRFSATIRIRWLMMAKAATKMMRVRITNIAVFSSWIAEKRFRFISVQSRVQNGSPSRRPRSWAIGRAR